MGDMLFRMASKYKNEREPIVLLGIGYNFQNITPHAIIFHIISTIHELLSTLLARGRRGADLSAALAHKTAGMYIFNLGQ